METISFERKEKGLRPKLSNQKNHFPVEYLVRVQVALSPENNTIMTQNEIIPSLSCIGLQARKIMLKFLEKLCHKCKLFCTKNIY